ncbi:Uncharacterized protein TCM_027653 [Theobroma cacao]|uniref:Transposase MuDR plant domain-containing protein n=1 Tax=Theobroma cacao TaxID=3641 RepID=A0A061G8Q4_THECC|nr:Uncharacterized protein TCM_027653 [Theobroma cacao]
MQPSPGNVVSPLPFAKDTVMVVSDGSASDQMDDDYEEDDTTDWNDEMDNNCEDNYVGRHDDCSKEDKGDNNDILDCNNSDGSTEHGTIVVFKDVQYNDLIYNNPIADDNGISSPDDKHFEVRVKQSCQAHFKIACKDKAFKFAVCAPKLPKGDYWQVCMFHKHLGVKNAVEKVYQDAYHDLCSYHLGKNLKNRFKCEDVTTIFTLATNCYRVTDFNRHMNKLKHLRKNAYDHLKKLYPKR